MAEGSERFRGLWEDEMFARQVVPCDLNAGPTTVVCHVTYG